MAKRDREARRAYERRYYAEHHDKIIARRRAREAARTPDERRRRSQRRRRHARPRRADLPSEHLERLRAADRERKRRPRNEATGISDARRAAAREATRRWYQRNKEHVRQARRPKDNERYAANRESILSEKRQRYASDQAFADGIRAQNRDWYRRNREKRRDYNRRYWREHGDELRARQRERNRRKYANDPRAALDYYKQWRLRNLERARAYVRISGNKRRAAKAGVHFTFGEWEELLRSHHGRCAYCGSTDRIEADHRTPLCRGGSNDIGNILPACRSCNRRKHRKTEDEFRALLEREKAND